VIFLVPYFSWRLILYYCSSPFCASFHNLPSHIFSSCLLVYLSYFSSRSLYFSSTYSISSVHWTRCSRLWCHPLADSICVLLSPGFSSSEKQGFEGTVSWKDTIQKAGRVLQRKEIPPCRCLRQTHFYEGRYLPDQTQKHGSLARRIHSCRITNGFLTRTRSMKLTLLGRQQCSSTNGSQWYKGPCCPI